MITFEDIFLDINDFGKYQYIRLGLILIGSLITPIVTYISIFVAPNPDHVCKHIDGHDKHESVYEQCSIVTNGSQYNCKSWDFDKTYYQSTLTEEWGLVCQNHFLRSHIQSVFFLGVLLGSVILGKLSDSFGRRPTVLIGLVCLNIGAIGSFLSVHIYFNFYVSYISYAFFGFVMAFGTRGMDEAGYVLALELVGPTKKALAGITIESFFAIGHIILVAAAYFLRDWKNLLLFMICFILPFLTYFKLVPESPRWLISKNRTEESLKILNQIAKENERDVDKEKWKIFCSQEDENSDHKTETFSKMIKHKFFMVVFIFTVLLWSAINIIFYGIGLKTNDLGIDPYSSFLIAGILELIACLSTFFIINRLGRKQIFIFSSLIIAGCCFLIVLIKNVEVNVVLAMSAKFAGTILFSTLRVYSNEIFPTTIRVSCIGACSTISRLGVAAVPFINAYGDKHWKPLPFFVFGVVSVMGTIISFFIPETLGKRPAENLDEFEELFTQKKQKTVENLIFESTLELKELHKMITSQKDMLSSLISSKGNVQNDTELPFLA